MVIETSLEKDILLTNLYPCEGRIMVIKTSQENILLKSMRPFSNKTLTKETSVSRSTWAAQGCLENVRNNLSEHNVLKRLLLDIASTRLRFHTFHLAPSLLLIFNVTPSYLLLRLNQLYILLTLSRCRRKDKTVFAVFLLHLLQPPPSPPRPPPHLPSAPQLWSPPLQ